MRMDLDRQTGHEGIHEAKGSRDLVDMMRDPGASRIMGAREGVQWFFRFFALPSRWCCGSRTTW
jgi:hypothetical protein